jgi:hypothetical protein
MRVILALALLLRIGVVWIVLASYPHNWLFSKAPDLGFLACSLSSGHGLSSPFGGSTGSSAFLAPGYPAVLGLIFYFFGSYTFTSAAVMMSLQTMFAVLTVAAIMYVARRLFGTPTALVAGVFWAVSPPLLWLPAVPWETSLSALLLIGMIAMALNQASHVLWAMMGAFCGLAMLVNPSLTLALFAILGWAAYQNRNGCTIVLDVCAGPARSLRGMALAECAGSARIYSPAQQFRIRAMAREPRRGQWAVQPDARTAAEQTGILRLCAGGRGRVHAEQISAGQDLYPRPPGRVRQAQRDAGDSLLDRRRFRREFRRG